MLQIEYMLEDLISQYDALHDLANGSFHLITTAKWHFFNSPYQIFLKSILCLHLIRTSKTAKFQILTSSRS